MGEATAAFAVVLALAGPGSSAAAGLVAGAGARSQLRALVQLGRGGDDASSGSEEEDGVELHFDREGGFQRRGEA